MRRYQNDWSLRMNEISIHAPTWGATLMATRVNICRLFQSTHPRGVRRGLYRSLIALLKFQSTHPRGVRRRVIGRYRDAGNFNPRTHVGCDQGDWQHSPHSCISIHAPTWGATANTKAVVRASSISIHAPTWGATPNKSGFDLSHEFQSTHPRGVRLELLAK